MNGHPKGCSCHLCICKLQENTEGGVKDDVNHPSHYNKGKIEVIDFIEDQKLGFHLGNVVKYACRSDAKGREIEDLKKAEWYLRRKIELLEKLGK